MSAPWVYHFVSLPLLLVAVFSLGRMSGLRSAMRILRRTQGTPPRGRT